MRTGTYTRSRGGLDALRRGRARGDGVGGITAGRGRGGGAVRLRSRDPEPDASWLFFVFRLKGQRPVMVCV
jgi:hypothetical protein